MNLVLLGSRLADPQYGNTTDWTWVSTLFVIVPIVIILIIVIGFAVMVHQENNDIRDGYPERAGYMIPGTDKRIRKSTLRMIAMVLLFRHQAHSSRGFLGISDSTHPDPTNQSQGDY